MSEILIKVVMAGFATLGFAIILDLNIRLLPFSFLGGIIAILTYLVGMEFTEGNLLLSNFLAAFTASLYSEICAIILKAPATVFLLPCNVSLVPGGGLYYTMQDLILHDREAFLADGTATLYAALGIAAGIMMSSILTHAVRKISAEIKHKRSKMPEASKK